MLVLSRKKNEAIQIGDNILITVTEIRGNKVRLGVVAPKDMDIKRSEIIVNKEESLADNFSGK